MKACRLLKNSLFVRLLGILMVFFFLSGFTAPEKPAYGIYDPNHYLTEETIDKIRTVNELNSKKDEKLQIGVYIVDSLDGESIETVANETARAWKIGFSGDDHGALIVIAIKDRKSRIETSNKAATKITDYQTKLLLQSVRNYFRNEDYNYGIIALVNGLNNQFYSGDDRLPSPGYGEIEDYNKNSRKGKSSSSRSNRKHDSSDEIVGVGIIIYFIVVFIAIIRGGGGGRGGGSSDGGWWYSDSSDSGSSWSSSDSSSGWDGGGFDGGGSSDNW